MNLCLLRLNYVGELTDGALMDGLKKFVNYLEETLKEQVRESKV